VKISVLVCTSFQASGWCGSKVYLGLGSVHFMFLSGLASRWVFSAGFGPFYIRLILVMPDLSQLVFNLFCSICQTIDYCFSFLYFCSFLSSQVAFGFNEAAIMVVPLSQANTKDTCWWAKV
jgi:hypothetical protein